MRGFTHESTHNESQEWYTPKSIFDALKIDFDLDPASPGPDVVPWVPALQHFTIKDNGLAMLWKGRVWLNPPYGSDTPAWMRAFVAHRNGIMLVFARTDTLWFHEMAIRCDALLFLKGRIQFVSADPNRSGKQQGCGAASMMLACGYDCVDALRKSGLGFFCNIGVASREGIA